MLMSASVGEEASEGGPDNSQLSLRCWLFPRALIHNAVQTVGATAGLEANKARRNGAAVPSLQQLAVQGGAQKPELESWQDTDWILLLIMTARIKG
ncbi:hypothetical protein JOQ06_000946 [Pogonophryne albipinna]|uniref:Uncharacterized protein n=1 Tax=Pogonophryne albipinna TaxID=1090488 RepID=A0AAD6B622_9TELE|nr:hypothetical protein JOQ06_000946 [Pogonophryne albipinna]